MSYGISNLELENEHKLNESKNHEKTSIYSSALAARYRYRPG